MPGQGDMTAPDARRRPLEARSRAVGLVSAIPAWAWLVVLVGLSVVIRTALALRDPSPWIFPDEIFYSELAKSLAHSGHFGLRGVPGTGGFGILYSTLIAPAWALFASLTSAYQAAKVINALLMSLGAVPVYLLARRLTPAPLALLAAVLTLALPGMVYTGALMTENAFFPVFLFWVLAVVLVLERPTAIRQLVAVALTFLAYLTRNQGAVLAPALATAIALFVLLEAWYADEAFLRTALRRAAAFAVTWATLLAGVCAFLVLEVGSRGKSFSNALLGPYSSLTGSTYSVHAALRWALYELGELDFATGVLPFAAFLLVLAAGLRGKGTPPATRAFAAVACSATVWLVLEVAFFASTPFGQQIQERNLFYLEPLFLVALVVWAGGLIPRAAAATGAAALVAVALVAVVPYDSFISPRIYTNALGLLPLARLEQHGWVAPSHLSDVVVLAALAGGLLFVLLPRRLALLAPAAVLMYLAVMNSPVEGLTHTASLGARLGAIGGARDWIDRAVGTKPTVSVLWTGSPDINFVSLWDNEFFNRSVGPVYNIHGPPDGLPQETLNFDYKTSQYRHANGKPVLVKYLLTDHSEIPVGTLVTNDAGTGMVLYRVDGPLQLAYETAGIYRDSWSGPGASFTIYGCRGGRLRLALLGDRGINPHVQRIVARDADSGRLLARTTARPSRLVRFVVPVPDGKPTCRIGFSVTPTAVPAETIHTGDTRTLGIRFLHPAYEPG